MPSRFKKHKRKMYILKEGISSQKIDELLPLDISKIQQIDYNPLEEITKRYIRRYKKYIKGREDYFFYDPYLGIRIWNDGINGKRVIQDKLSLFFELDKHFNKREVNNLKKVINFSDKD